jgi:hypothetical protein
MGLFSVDITLDNSCGTNINSLGFYLVSPEGKCMTVFVGTNNTTNFNSASRFLSLSLRDASCLIFPNINTGVTFNNLSYTTGGNYGTFLAGASASPNRFSNVFNNVGGTPTNPNGTWFLYFFHGNSVNNYPCVTKASLTFANTSVADKTPDGDNCDNPIIYDGRPFCATTNSKNPSSQMPGSSSPTTFSNINGVCNNWNGANNNDIWIRYDANKSGYFCFNFSGIFGRYPCNEPSGTCQIAQQSIVVTDANADNDNNPCTQNNNLKTGSNDPYWNVVSCPTNQSVYSTSSGTTANQQHCFTVVAGKTYYLVIDGTSGSTASFYISGLYGVSQATLDNRLLSLKGESIMHENKLNWTTSILHDQIQRIYLERSNNGILFHQIYSQLLSSTDEPVKQYTDQSPLPSTNFYRLKVTLKDGTIFYSSVVELKGKGRNGISVYPNPVVNELHIDAANKIDQINIFNSQGQLVYSDASVSVQTLKISTLDWNKGQYHVVVRDILGNIETTRIVK